MRTAEPTFATRKTLMNVVANGKRYSSANSSAASAVRARTNRKSFAASYPRERLLTLSDIIRLQHRAAAWRHESHYPVAAAQGITPKEKPASAGPVWGS